MIYELFNLFEGYIVKVEKQNKSELEKVYDHLASHFTPLMLTAEVKEIERRKLFSTNTQNLFQKSEEKVFRNIIVHMDQVIRGEFKVKRRKKKKEEEEI